MYSRDDALTDDDRAAFKASQFKLGHVPERPPTQALAH